MPPSYRRIDRAAQGAAFPFLICDAMLILAMIAVPEIVLYLPNLMR